MRDIITATSASIAVLILVFCFFEDVDVETALLRALLAFGSSFSLAYLGWFVFKVNVKSHDDDEIEEEKHLEDEQQGEEAQAPANA